MLGFAIIAGLIAFVMLGVALSLLGHWRRMRAGLAAQPYRRAPAVLSPKHLALLAQVQSVLEPDQTALAKVRAWDLVEIPSETRYPEVWRDRALLVEVDVLVLGPLGEPLAVVQIDKPAQPEGLSALRRILSAAKVPIVLIPADVALAGDDLAARIRRAISSPVEPNLTLHVEPAPDEAASPLATT